MSISRSRAAASFPAVDPAASLPSLLERAANHFPERGVAVFDGRGRRHERRAYPDLLDGARVGAGRWAALGVAPGDRVLVALGTSWSWLDAWLGALCLGALPVAVAPGSALGGGRAWMAKVDALVERLDARFVLAGDRLRADATEAGFDRAAAAAITVAELEGTTPAFQEAPGSSGEDIAFLQLTSGSTGVPRAVQIPHRAALHNSRASDLAIGAAHEESGGAPAHAWADSMVSWLPLHHDMGLVGCLFLSIYAGLDLWLLSPATFLARPRLWLDHLGRHGTTFAPAPNFGYQLCLERLTAEQREGLDLSKFRAAMTGAEMVRPETVRDFLEAFSPYGFRPEAFRPCYGLAEGTLAVTFDQKGQGLRTRQAPEATTTGYALAEIACVGEPVVETTVRITAPDGRALPDGETGEVCVAGPSVFAGYWTDSSSQESGPTGDGLQDGWLHTGDLGFLHEGELYLTGRTKDILVIRGHNVMPHEIEWQAEAVVGGGGATRSGAFSIARDAAGEQAVVVVETTETDPANLPAIAREIRDRVGRSLSLPLADVAFVRRGRLHKTTSGKVQRRELRGLYLEGALDLLATVPFDAS